MNNEYLPNFIIKFRFILPAVRRSAHGGWAAFGRLSVPEAYLITHADIAPSQVDWGADAIEHVLDREMIHKLENILPELKDVQMPPSPHELIGAQPAG